MGSSSGVLCVPDQVARNCHAAAKGSQVTLRFHLPANAVFDQEFGRNASVVYMAQRLRKLFDRNPNIVACVAHVPGANPVCVHGELPAQEKN